MNKVLHIGKYTAIWAHGGVVLSRRFGGERSAEYSALYPVALSTGEMVSDSGQVVNIQPSDLGRIQETLKRRAWVE